MNNGGRIFMSGEENHKDLELILYSMFKLQDPCIMHNVLPKGI